ncbi:MAG: cobalamin B12-binding domain-containing protein [Proteobacteria bacterium]|nr:cobalamin B12-binding domain-containing protein [Pseudomonadota bacterium]
MTGVPIHRKSPSDASIPGRPARVLVTKIGLDGHDRGSRLVAGFFSEAGMEVIYTKPWQTPETVVRQALEEDVDAIGISSLATDHLLVPGLMEALANAGLDDVVVVVGGIVPAADEQMLKDAGVAEVFHPGSSRNHIVSSMSRLIAERRAGTGED